MRIRVKTVRTLIDFDVLLGCTCTCMCMYMCVYCFSYIIALICCVNSFYFFLYRKFPELFSSFKTLLGFKDPGLVEALPSSGGTTSFSNKERVTEFAAEIGKYCTCAVPVYYSISSCGSVTTCRVLMVEL